MVENLVSGPVKAIMFDWADDGVTLCSYQLGEKDIYDNLEAATPFAEDAITWGVVLVLAWSTTVPDQVYRFTIDGWGYQG